MGKHDKLVERLLNKPSDFSLAELRRLMSAFGYELSNKGKTSGSRIAFEKGVDSFRLHKPHGREPVLLHYQVKELIEFLRQRGLI